MKLLSLFLIFSLFSNCTSAHRVNPHHCHAFKKELRDEEVGPMLYLIKAVNRYPGKSIFVLSFHALGAQSLYLTTVRYNKISQKLSLYTEEVARGRELRLYSRVSLQKIKAAYHLKSTRSLESQDNFDLLSDVGCAEQVIYSKPSQ